jgi:hypothetical protein
MRLFDSPEDGKWEAMENDFWEDEEKCGCSIELWKKFEAANLSDDLMDIVDKALMYGIELGRKEEKEYQDEEKSLSALNN